MKKARWPSPASSTFSRSRRDRRRSPRGAAARGRCADRATKIAILIAPMTVSRSGAGISIDRRNKLKE
jgi:hypothetical protein